MTGTGGRELVESHADELTTWLMTLVDTRQYGDLAQLRRATAGSSARYRAGWYAPNRESRELFEQVAFLFAVYHQGRKDPTEGYGSFAKAARQIGRPSVCGPEDPGATRLIDRIVASRRIPWRHLRHGVARLRTCDKQPPSWSGLVADLHQWHDRKARIAYYWAVDFHEPQDLRRSTPQKGANS